ncbi:LysR family transcriptional regulator [Flexivirga endophytica]|uniref:LysR family transcriptional regulator n=1 Tax=Flexivirga endophytica TaxID=1849103 RepID=A0A916T022_9MICO|nr:LysR substrate-binding domain-containing protein [Flexivirga endophytica]GGB25968.1 LysR family transcriptional regulator [Flexivirga endophytica]GHB54525.1 LysR family transcriptional regulator [Flexivirga endophytica]
MEPETRLLRYFLAVADELNFTRAAKRLHIAQPTLSAQIRQLESQLGVALLRRNTRAVSLTEAGRTLADEGAMGLAAMQHAWETARQVGRGEAGTLRLAYPLSAARDTAPRLIHAVHETHPGISVTTEVVPTPTVLRSVRDGRADVGLAREARPLKGVQLQPLRRDPIGVLVATTHPLAAQETVGLAAVASRPLALHPRTANPAHHDFVLSLFTDRGLQPELLERDIAFDFNHEFIADGAATALIGRSSAHGLPAGIRWIPLDESVTVTVMLVLPMVDRPPTSRTFEQLAIAHAREHHWVHGEPTESRRATEPGSTQG